MPTIDLSSSQMWWRVDWINSESCPCVGIPFTGNWIIIKSEVESTNEI